MTETLVLIESLWGAVALVSLLFAGMFFAAIFRIRGAVLLTLLTVSLFGLYNLFYVIDSHIGRATTRDLPQTFYVAAFSPGKEYDYVWIIEDLTNPDGIRAYQLTKEQTQRMQAEAAESGSGTLEGTVVERSSETEIEEDEDLVVRQFNPEKDLGATKMPQLEL